MTKKKATSVFPFFSEMLCRFKWLIADILLRLSSSFSIDNRILNNIIDCKSRPLQYELFLWLGILYFHCDVDLLNLNYSKGKYDIDHKMHYIIHTIV